MLYFYQQVFAGIIPVWYETMPSGNSVCESRSGRQGEALCPVQDAYEDNIADVIVVAGGGNKKAPSDQGRFFFKS